MPLGSKQNNSKLNKICKGYYMKVKIMNHWIPTLRPSWPKDNSAFTINRMSNCMKTTLCRSVKRLKSCRLWLRLNTKNKSSKWNNAFYSWKGKTTNWKRRSDCCTNRTKCCKQKNLALRQLTPSWSYRMTNFTHKFSNWSSVMLTLAVNCTM